MNNKRNFDELTEAICENCLTIMKKYKKTKRDYKKVINYIEKIVHSKDLLECLINKDKTFSEAIVYHHKNYPTPNLRSIYKKNQDEYYYLYESIMIDWWLNRTLQK